MLKASVLLDKFLKQNTQYYDMHRIVTTRVVKGQGHFGSSEESGAFSRNAIKTWVEG